jgi:hypothetical protein
MLVKTLAISRAKATAPGAKFLPKVDGAPSIAPFLAEAAAVRRSTSGRDGASREESRRLLWNSWRIVDHHWSHSPPASVIVDRVATYRERSG